MGSQQSAPTPESLLDVVYRHFPRGIEFDDPRHRVSEESRRLACVHEAAALACGKGAVPVPDDERVPIDPQVARVVDMLGHWKRFGERCRQEFLDREVWDESGPFFDPGYRYTVAQAGYVEPSRNPRRGVSDDGQVLANERAAEPDDGGRRDPVICVVSVLAPVYAILTLIPVPDDLPELRFTNFPGRYHDRIATLSAIAEDVFGFCRLDAESLRIPVPDVQPHTTYYPMSETTLSDCLFTTLY